MTNNEPHVAGNGNDDRHVVCDTFNLLGYRADVCAPSGGAHAQVRALLRGFGPVPSAAETLPRFGVAAGEAGGWEVRVNTAVVHADGSFPSALGMLEWYLVSAALDHRQDLVHLHGSALCLPTERAGLLLVGGSGRGKTTLTMGLMLRGFVPFTDDVALIDPETLELQVLRRAFHIAESTWPLLESFGGPLARGETEPAGYFSPPQWAEHPVPVKWLLLPEYRPQQKPELVALSATEAAAAIVGQTLSLARAPRLTLRTAARLTEQAPCFRFLCGDLTDSVAVVQRLVAAPVATPSQQSRG